MYPATENAQSISKQIINNQDNTDTESNTNLNNSSIRCFSKRTERTAFWFNAKYSPSITTTYTKAFDEKIFYTNY
jgi:hypothetical protein